ncbi:hypothetical protein KKB40_03425, partial [Patescibacteria group bacterium]|nr:hypothetical protein [Patescibacteria group bacterium]
TWIYFLAKEKYPDLTSSIMIGTLFMSAFTFLYWAFTPYLILESISRYLITGAVGFSIILSSFVTLSLKSVYLLKEKRLLESKTMKIGLLMIPLAMLVFWLGFNFQAVQLYLGTLEKNRNKTLTQKTWKTLMQSVPTLDPNYPSVFYFTTDNPASLYGVLTYGFWPRAGTLYKVEKTAYTPVAVVDYETLLEYALDGSPLKKIHGRNFTDPVPPLNIYAFDFRKGKLTETTDQVRQKIISDLEDLDKKEPANQ